MLIRAPHREIWLAVRALTRPDALDYVLYQMNMELTAEEKALLKKTIIDYLNRLRDEIYKKRAYGAHQALKREEVLLMDLLRRLAEPPLP